MVSLTAWNKKDIKSIIDSGKFDNEFYLKENPDVKKSGLDPVIHYVLYGVHENRNPNDNFNTEYIIIFIKMLSGKMKIPLHITLEIMTTCFSLKKVFCRNIRMFPLRML